MVESRAPPGSIRGCSGRLQTGFRPGVPNEATRRSRAARCAIRSLPGDSRPGFTRARPRQPAVPKPVTGAYLTGAGRVRWSRAGRKARSRKVRAPAGRLPGNAWAPKGDGQGNREQTADGPRERDQARVKRWGKSPPRGWQQRRHGNPQSEQGQISGEVGPHRSRFREDEGAAAGRPLEVAGDGHPRQMTISRARPGKQNSAYGSASRGPPGSTRGAAVRLPSSP